MNLLITDILIISVNVISDVVKVTCDVVTANILRYDHPNDLAPSEDYPREVTIAVKF